MSRIGKLLINEAKSLEQDLKSKIDTKYDNFNSKDKLYKRARDLAEGFIKVAKEQEKLRDKIETERSLARDTDDYKKTNALEKKFDKLQIEIELQIKTFSKLLDIHFNDALYLLEEYLLSKKHMFKYIDY